MKIPPIESAFTWATGASLGAAALIVLGLALFLAFPRVFGPRWRFAFGVLVLVRLLLPFSIESRLSLQNLWASGPKDPGSPALLSSPNFTPEKSELSADPIIEASHEFPDFLTQNEIAFLPTSPGPDPTPEQPLSVVANPVSPPDFSTILACAWLAGVLAFSLTLFLRYFLLKRWLAANQSDSRDNSHLHALLDQARSLLDIRRPIPLVTVPHLKTAAVFGWRRPRLLIGESFSDCFSDSEIRGIFLHELAHVRRHDVLWNWLAQAALALHWFNPLVWMAVRRFQADREQICDAIALDHLSPQQRRRYGDTLLAALNRLPGLATGKGASSPSLSPFFTRKSEIKNRLTMIKRKQKTTSWFWHLLAALAVATTGAVTFTTALADDDDEKENKDREESREKPGRDRERDEADERERPRPERERERPDQPRVDRKRPDQPRPEHRDREDGRPEPQADRERPRPPQPGREGDRERPRPAAAPMPPELREFAEQVERLRHEVHELARAGKADQAEEREKKLRHLMEERPELAERFHQHQRQREHHEIDNHRREMHAALEKAEREGNEAGAAEIRREIEKVHHAVARRDRGEHLERRVHHLRQAAENLEAAGLHDQARKLHEQAEQAEREMRHHGGEGRDHELRQHAENLEREVHELREVVGDLREEIEKLKDQLRERD